MVEWIYGNFLLFLSLSLSFRPLCVSLHKQLNISMTLFTPENGKNISLFCLAFMPPFSSAWHLALFDYRAQLNNKNGDLCVFLLKLFIFRFCSLHIYATYFMFVQYKTNLSCKEANFEITRVSSFSKVILSFKLIFKH